MIIGVRGKARSGKDTFAEFLITEFGLQGKFFHSVAFADDLKRMCMELFDLEVDQLWGDKKEIEDERYSKVPYMLDQRKSDGWWCGSCEPLPAWWTPREIMQEVGSFFRKIDYDFWVRRLHEVIYGGGNWIITDVRHVNEALYVKKYGFLINVTRSVAPSIHNQNHESEIALDSFEDYDLTVINDWGLEELNFAAKEAAQFLVEMDKMKTEGVKTNG